MRRRVVGLVALALVMATIVTAPAEARPRSGSSGEPVISVEWRRDVWQAPEIRLMDEAGATALTLGVEVYRGGWPRWSRDGSKIGGYIKRTGEWYWDRSLHRIGATGIGEELIISAAELDAFIDAMPGHGSAYESGVGSPFGVAAWGPSDEVAFATLVRYDMGTADSSDDRHLSRLVVNRSTGLELLSADVPGEFQDTDPHWSWTTGKVVFVRTPVSCSSNGACYPSDGAQLWQLDPTTKAATRIAADFSTVSQADGTHLFGPVWSRDGTRIAVTGNVPGGATGPTPRGDVWIVDTSAVPPAVTAFRSDPTKQEGSAVWSPDDTSLLFLRTWRGSRNYVYEVVVAPVAGATAEKVIVTSTKQAILYPDWRPSPTSS